MAKKTFTPVQGRPTSNVQLVSNLYGRTKALLWKKGQNDHLFLVHYAQNILFQLPNLKKLYCLGDEGTPAY